MRIRYIIFTISLIIFAIIIFLLVAYRKLPVSKEKLPPRLSKIAFLESKRTFSGHNKIIVSLDGKYTALCYSSTISILETETASTISNLYTEGERISDIVFSADNKFLIAGHEKAISVWETAHWQKIVNLKISNASSPTQNLDITSITISNNDKLLAIGQLHGIVSIIDTQTWQQTISFNTNWDNLLIVFFSHDSQFLAVGYATGIIKIYETTNWNEIATTYEHKDDIRSIAFSNDGKYMFSGDDESNIKIWQTNTWMNVNSFTVRDRGNCSTFLAFPNNGNFMTAGACSKITVLDITDIKNVKELLSIRIKSKGKYLSERNEYVKSMVFSKDGSLLFVSTENVVKIFEVGTWKEQNKDVWEDKGSIKSLAFINDAITIAAGYEQGTIKIWQISETGNGQPGVWKEIHTMNMKRESVESLAVSNNMKYLVSGSNREIKVWDIANGRELLTIDGTNGADELIFSNDDKYLYAIFYDNRKNFITMWETETWKKIKTTHLKVSLGFSQALTGDGRLIGTIQESGIFRFRGSKSIKIWNMETWRALPDLKGSGASSMITSRECGDIPDLIDLSANGEVAAVIYRDRCIKVWRIADNEKIAMEPFHPPPMYTMAIALSKDGKLLATGNLSGAIEIWKVM